MPIFKAAFRKNAGRKAAKAAFAGNFAQAFNFIDKGGDINTTRWVEGPASAINIENDTTRGVAAFEQTGGEGNIGYSAITHNNLPALKEALDRGLNPDLQSPYRVPLLVFAIQNKHEDAALLLLERGATPATYMLADCISPLALAHLYKMPELVRRIEAKLSPTALEAARQSNLPWGVHEEEKQKKPKRLSL